MENYHFISYSTVDAQDFAIKLCDLLQQGPPSIRAWLDKREIKPIQDYDDQIVDALKDCDSLIFIMTSDSVKSKSLCKQEYTRAIRYKKPITLIKLEDNVDPPLQFENRQYIDFTNDFETGLAKFRNHIVWLKSSEGKLHLLKDRLEDADRDLQRAVDEGQQMRIKDEIESLKQQIADQELVVKDPEAVKERVQESISTGIERERQPNKPISGVKTTKFINQRPGAIPTYFQNRHVETKLVEEFLEGEVERLMTIIGRAGIGKTSMICRLLKFLEEGRLSESDKELSVDGIIYLSERGSQRITFYHLFFDLCRLLPKDVAKEMEEKYKNPNASTKVKMEALLHAFPKGRIVVLLDNFEDKIDIESREIADDEIDMALRTILRFEPHAVKVILTTRVAPKTLALIAPPLQNTITLDEGLGSPYAENILRQMDKDGKVGLKDASEELLDEARQRTSGYPRALEALFAILSSDRDTSLQEVLADTQNILPGRVVEVMVGEAYSRLDADAKMVMQALAIYGHPVSNVALDYILQPHWTGVNSTKVVKRLVNMLYVRKEGTRYYLHPVDRDYALSTIPEGVHSDKDNETVFSKFSLRNRAAQFFSETRLPREEWKSIKDLEPQLAEFELRFKAEDYDAAFYLLFQITYDYILLWGHYKLGITLYKQIKDKISDSHTKGLLLSSLGSFYYEVAQYQDALDCFEECLALMRDTNDVTNEGVALGLLALSYESLGNTQAAINSTKESLEISIASGDLQNKCVSLGNLGFYHGLLNPNQEAIDYCEQALKLAKSIEDIRQLGDCSTWMAEILIDQDKFEEAEIKLNRAIQIADDISDNYIQSRARYNLGLVFIFKDNFVNALQILNEAEKYDFAPMNHNIWRLQGLIHLGNHEIDEAIRSFSIALQEAQSLLSSSDNYKAFDSKAFSLCGLALCHEEDNDVLDQAKQDYMKARKINSDKGYVKYRVLRLFDKLSELDKKGNLQPLRIAVIGN